MMSKTERFREEIDAAHEFRYNGDAQSWDGCGSVCTSTCPICGLVKLEYAGGQRWPDSVEFVDVKGEPVCYAHAVRCL